MSATCARRGCSKPLPKLAIDHLDEFCSNTCARLAHGLESAKPREGRAQQQRKCSGCGCEVDSYTSGCRNCKQRLRYRGLAAA